MNGRDPKTYEDQCAAVLGEGWGDHCCIEETKDGRTIMMPQWVMDYACRHVDGAVSAAVMQDPEGWRVVDGYTAEGIWGSELMSFEQATQLADRINESLDIGPRVIPRAWAVIVVGR